MLKGIDHVQIAIPVGGEDLARPFYRDLLGLPEVPKPPELAARGGAWFESDAVKVHLGVEEDFRANVKAHVAFQVDDRLGLAERAKTLGLKVTRQGDQIYIYDPFGNRLEFVEVAASLPSPWRGEGPGMGVGSAARPKTSKATRETVVPGGVPRARRLRAELTYAERLLWERLRKLRIHFRRQTPIGRYIADFAHHASKLVVEIDGPLHGTPEAQAHDANRTTWLRSAGYRVIRFTDRDVVDRLDEIVERIAAEAVPPPSPTLPPSRGKGEKRYEVR